MPPKKHLVLDPQSGQIVVREGDGANNADFPQALSHLSVINGHVSVYCTQETTAAELNRPAQIFEVRHGGAALFRDTRSAVEQLQGQYAKDGTGYVAVGGSPKLVKWLLKKRGFKVVTVNVSKVAPGMSPTPDFLKYLEVKLTKLGNPARIVVMDFADTGGSLIQLKADVARLREDKDIRTVAVGTSDKFNASYNAANKAKIDVVLVGIPNLSKALTEQQLKLHILGRNKEKNEYESWSKEQSTVLAGKAGKGSSIKQDTTLSAHYQTQKAIMPQVIDLPELVFLVEDLFGEHDDSSSSGEGTSTGADDDDDFK